MQFEQDSVQEPPSQARVAHLQNVFGVVFPEDYLAFIAYGNCGVPVHRCFKLGDNVRVIDRFLGLIESPRDCGEIGWYDVNVVFSQIEDRLVEDEEATGTLLVPVAALVGGDFVCLDYRDDNVAVCVWDHEMSGDSEPATVRVAPSFSEFLRQLS
jgi:hypothetical protein